MAFNLHKYPTARRLEATLALFTLFSATVNADVAQLPLFLTSSVKPNVMLMLDNSMSMAETLTVSSSGADYNPATTYPTGANCSSNALPNSTTGTQTDSSLNTKTKCQNAGGSWSSSKNRCTVTVTTPVTYGTSIPSKFFGYKSGYTIGTKCFASNLSYTTSLSLPADVTTAAQRANYLNWYYGNEIAKAGTTSTRLQVAKNAANFLVDSLTSDTRLGFTTFNVDNGGMLWEAIDDLGDSKKTNIKNRINATSANAHTPLAETMADIGNYFTTGSSNVVLKAGTSNASTASKTSALPSALVNSTGWSGRTAISGEPTFSSSPIQQSCQRNFAVLITDGLPSSDRDISTNSYLNDYDGDCSGSHSNECTTFDMKKAYPYPGGNGATPNLSVANAGSNSSDYLDDVTQALYEMDLRPDLRNANESKKAKNNLTTFVVGFADDAINPNMPGVNPLPRDAALQGGGKFYFAGNEAELSASLASAFGFIAEQASASSSVATNSTQFQTDTLIYLAVFDSSDWSGNLQAFRILTEDLNGNKVLDPGEDTNSNGKLDAGAIGSKIWNADALIPSPANRDIFSYDPSATTGKGIPFIWTSLNTSQQNILGSQAVVDYLRGDQTLEQSNGGTFKNRSNILGDIVNSDPLFVGRDDAGYATLPGSEGSSYGSFVSTTRRQMIYVGANDGMLHGFDASTGIDGGKELFAYVPNSVISSNLVTLTNPTYSHHYFVDGSAQSSDVFYGSAWHTVLVGSLGGGGKGVFALDITDPDTFGDSNVLWEFSSTNDADLGYTLPQASVVRMANGQWAAIVANGYNSLVGKAVLFIINIETGALIKKIEAETASGTNGLSSPVAVDSDNDKIVDYIYAGDLNGNLWKFDVSSSDTANWGVAYAGLPVFVAEDSLAATQPITAKPAVGKATANGQTSGVMIYVGTGKYFETGDNVVPTTPQVQSFYAIWDQCDKSSAVGCNGVVSGRTSLQQQSIIAETSSPTLADGATANSDVRITSHCEVGYGSTVPTTTGAPCTNNVNRRGWYMDLVSPVAGLQGEKVVSMPILRHGVVIFPTLIPNTNVCTAGGTSWLMELDQLSGARLAGTPIDLNGDGKVDANDMVMINGIAVAASGVKSQVGIVDTPAVINCENGIDCKYTSGSSANLWLVKEKAPESVNPTLLPARRQSWRQLL